MINTCQKIIYIGHDLVNSIAWGLGGKLDYVIEGDINISGDTL